MQILIVLILAFFGAMTLIAWIAASRADTAQAQAVMQIADVASDLAADNSRLVVTNILLIVILLLVILAAVAAVVMFSARARRLAEKPAGPWAPGPNAYFQRQQPQQLPAGDAQTILMLMMMQQLTQSQRPQLPAQAVDPQYQLPASSADNPLNPFPKSVDSWW